MQDSKGSNGADSFYKVVVDFGKVGHAAPPRLSVHERDKIRDLQDDVEYYEPQLEKETALGCAFGHFEWFVGLPWPYWLLRPLRWFRQKFLHKRRAGRKLMACHALPKATDNSTLAFADDFFLFDRLSLIYGGQFRGSIVVNYVLGILASGILVFSLTIGSEWLRADALAPYRYFPTIFSLFELFCLVLIGYIYCTGATPETEEHRPSWAPGWTWQRWHQRWLEYRLLAERFRYLDLLLPFGENEATDISIAPGGEAATMWHQRYFEWRIAKTKAATIGMADYCQHVTAVMIAQERYHAHNYLRRGTIADGLHALAVRMFLFGLLLCIVNFCIEAYSGFCSHCASEKLELWRHWIVFLAALLPILSAAIHGILANTEYTKVADTSGEIAHRIYKLVDQFSAVPVPADWEDENALVPTRNVVREFVELVINEATGWRAMLRDKNVPLA